jgi:hypothetical protein
MAARRVAEQASLVNSMKEWPQRILDNAQQNQVLISNDLIDTALDALDDYREEFGKNHQILKEELGLDESTILPTVPRGRRWTRT